MLFTPQLAGRATVSVRGPLVLDDGTEVYPDLQVLKLREDGYRKTNPTGEDTLLVVEVVDTSLAFDLQVKLPRYARTGNAKNQRFPRSVSRPRSGPCSPSPPACRRWMRGLPILYRRRWPSLRLRG